jgi:hypothetical protein
VGKIHEFFRLLIDPWLFGVADCGVDAVGAVEAFGIITEVPWNHMGYAIANAYRKT